MAKTVVWAGKMMNNVFVDLQGVIFINYLHFLLHYYYQQYFQLLLFVCKIEKTIRHAEI